MHGTFFDITIALVLATVLALIFRMLKQPAVLAYILAGIIIGPLGLVRLNDPQALSSFSEIGITLLLFLLGLELKLNELRSVGKVSLLTGIGQIVITSAVGYILAIALGFSSTASAYIAVGLTFSSTIVIVKLLSDKKDINSLYGKVAIGFLLVQDFFAIVALVVLTGLDSASGGQSALMSVILVLLKATILFAIIVYLSQVIFPKIIHYISKSTELLFLFSLAWALGLAMVVSSPLVGLSIEIGGFLAGLALANSRESYQIVSKVQSLRDFFITLFFVTLGSALVVDSFLSSLPIALILSAFVLIGNPIIVMMIMGYLGFRRRTSFFAGLTVAQISEFSLIVIFLGRKLGHVTDEVITLMTLVAIITFTLSTYAILNNVAIYNRLEKYLKIFERKDAREKTIKSTNLKGHTVLIGAHRIGMSIITSMKGETDNLVVIDFDPHIIEILDKKGVQSIFGDISEPEIQHAASLQSAKVLVSTVPDIEDNLILLSALRKANPKLVIIVAVHHNSHASDLYAAGVDYVVMPHMLMGQRLGSVLRRGNFESLGKLPQHSKAFLSEYKMI